MDELTRYIFYNYSHLMTAQESAAYKSIIGEQKAGGTDNPNMRALLRERFVSADPEVRAMLKKGQEQFLTDVRDRIIRERADDVFLNCCPQCGALTKTPRAKQCPKCFFSWHDET